VPRWGRLSLSRQLGGAQPAPFRLQRGLIFLSLSLSLSRALPTRCRVGRESAAILYIVKTFTISLGTFIIPQLNLPCFAAERYPAVALIYHLKPLDPETISTFPPTADRAGRIPRVVSSVVTRSHFPISSRGRERSLRALIKASLGRYAENAESTESTSRAAQAG